MYSFFLPLSKFFTHHSPQKISQISTVDSVTTYYLLQFCFLPPSPHFVSQISTVDSVTTYYLLQFCFLPPSLYFIAQISTVDNVTRLAFSNNYTHLPPSSMNTTHHNQSHQSHEDSQQCDHTPRSWGYTYQ